MSLTNRNVRLFVQRHFATFQSLVTWYSLE